MATYEVCIWRLDWCGRIQTQNVTVDAKDETEAQTIALNSWNKRLPLKNHYKLTNAVTKLR